MKFDDIYLELKKIAHAQLQRHSAQTLGTTELVHEAFLKLAQADGATSREHRISLVVRVVRQVLVDAARRRQRDKRGGDANPARIALDTEMAERIATFEPLSNVDLLALDQAVANLKTEHPRMGQVVELHIFVGFDHDEIAEMLGVTRRTVTRDWTAAKVLLAHALRDFASPNGG